MKKINLIYLLAGLAGIGLLPFFKSKLTHSVEFYGIAENPVSSINFDYPVEIIRLFKMQGETLLKGDTIMTLRRLDQKSREITLQFELADNDLRLHTSLEALAHELALIENQKTQLETEFRYEGELLKQKIDKFQTSKGFLLQNDSLKSTNLGFETSIKQLESEFKQNLAGLNLKLKQKQNDKTALLENHRLRRAKLQNELDVLRSSSGELTVVSSGNGMVGQLEFGEGDRIPEFTAIAKFYDQHPSMVSFYIGDQQLTLLNEGDSVWIESINTPDFKFKGTVHAMGNRITSLPERLKKIPDLRAWGREVQVRIPASNPFLQGEKVKVHF